MNARWQLQGAKAEFSALIRAAETDGPQTITRNGKPVAVVLSQAEYERMSRQTRARKGSLLRFLAERMYLSVVIIGEILKGIDLIPWPNNRDLVAERQRVQAQWSNVSKLFAIASQVA